MLLEMKFDGSVPPVLDIHPEKSLGESQILHIVGGKYVIYVLTTQCIGILVIGRICKQWWDDIV
jgi:hypothetical protein